MTQQYNAKDIQSLDIIDAIRLRVGMYLSSNGIEGVHNALLEVISNAIDEYLVGYGTKIIVHIHKDNSITVQDFARGIPVDIMEDGISALTAVFTKSHTGGKFTKDEGGYTGNTGGLNGIGLKATNATSEWLSVQVMRDGKIYEQKFEYGKSITEVKKIGVVKNNATGTTISFLPDKTIFTDIHVDSKKLEGLLQELAFLSKGLEIEFIDDRYNKKVKFKYANGLLDYINHLTKDKKNIQTNPFYFAIDEDGASLEVAVMYNEGYSAIEKLYTNNIPNVAGTHLTGYRAAFTRTINDYARTKKLLKAEHSNFTGEDLREGLTLILSLKIANPVFAGQTKSQLNSAEARKFVEGHVNTFLRTWLEANPLEAKRIIEKMVAAQQAREAAKKAKDLVRKQSTMVAAKPSKLAMPTKLADCQSTDAKTNELFIVEGDSAGGSAKEGRNKRNQAILPLKGKIINTLKNTLEKVLHNDEIKDMVVAIGTGIGKDFKIQNLRYDKIIIMTDADVDGHHIKVLFLTFIYNFMPELIAAGKVYSAQPPLYRIKKGTQTWYAQDDAELQVILAKVGTNAIVTRFKGLGEMDSDVLYETTMNPATRTLIQFTMEDAKKVSDIVNDLMGTKTEPRKQFIFDNAIFAEITV